MLRIRHKQRCGNVQDLDIRLGAGTKGHAHQNSGNERLHHRSRCVQHSKGQSRPGTLMKLSVSQMTQGDGLATPRHGHMTRLGSRPLDCTCYIKGQGHPLLSHTALNITRAVEFRLVRWISVLASTATPCSTNCLRYREADSKSVQQPSLDYISTTAVGKWALVAGIGQDQQTRYLLLSKETCEGPTLCMCRRSYVFVPWLFL